MSQLFTTYEALQPPEIITPELKQDYQEIQTLTIPDIEQDGDIDWGFLESSNETLESPIKTQPVQTTNNSPIQRVIDTARSFVGSKYSWGGSSPSTGFDCSGLMQYAFKQAGIDLPRTAAAQGKVGQKVDISETKPGDVIWFGSKRSPSGQHIGLVSRVEKGQIYIIDAAGKAKGVVERPLPNLEIKSIRRFFGTSNFGSRVIDFFRNKGLSENQARGILGNLMQESRGNHTVVNSKSGAFGLAQWLGPRKQKLQQKYGKNPTVDQQLEFIWEELNTTESKAMQALLNTNTVSDATRAFANHFERAGKDEMNMNQRIKYAYSV